LDRFCLPRGLKNDFFVEITDRNLHRFCSIEAGEVEFVGEFGVVGEGLVVGGGPDAMLHVDLVWVNEQVFGQTQNTLVGDEFVPLVIVLGGFSSICIEMLGRRIWFIAQAFDPVVDARRLGVA
jgi:hypothetical protein